MANINLMPVVGINMVEEDSALMRESRNEKYLYVRDAVNVDLTKDGKIELRKGAVKVSDSLFRNLWQSPLHKDVFGTLNGYWGKVNTANWTHEALLYIGEGYVSHEVVNNLVIVAGSAGIFTYNGSKAERLTIEVPATPLVITGTGALDPGRYGVSIAWLRGSLESSLSAMNQIQVESGQSLEITIPMCLDQTVTGFRLYLTEQNGSELRMAEDYPIATSSISLPLLPDLGRAAQFQHLSPMPTGKYLKYWRGRLITAWANVLRFSQPMTYHLHDERYDFVQMPQRITFVQPVENGIWVGQVNHVAFISGSTLNEFSIINRAVKAPVPDSAVLVDADVVGEVSGGLSAVIWLSQNGYVIGTASGQVSERQANAIENISARSGTSVVLDERILTTVV